MRESIAYVAQESSFYKSQNPLAECALEHGSDDDINSSNSFEPQICTLYCGRANERETELEDQRNLICTVDIWFVNAILASQAQETRFINEIRLEALERMQDALYTVRKRDLFTRL